MALGGPLCVLGLQSPSAIVPPGDCRSPRAAAWGTGHLLSRPQPLVSAALIPQVSGAWGGSSLCCASCTLAVGVQSPTRGWEAATLHPHA